LGVALAGMLAGSAAAQDTNTIFFDGTGDEAGITFPGATDFSIFGSNWTGGEVATVGLTRLYASGRFAYMPDPGGATVTFDTPVDAVDFFYVHRAGVEPVGTVTLLDTAGGVIATAPSNPATFFADPGNFLSFDPAQPIGSLLFDGGHIDNFTFTTVPAPGAIGVLGLSLVATVRRRR